MGWRKKALFSLIVVAVILGLAELALWLAGVPTLLERRDPFRGFSSSVRVFEPVQGRDVLATPARIAQHSFNYQEFLADKPPGGLRLFTIGGSSAHGFPWGAPLAFTRLAGDALQAALSERRVEAINAAAVSYGSHRLRILAEELVGYDTDVLVVYGGHNEFVETRFFRDLLDRPAALDPLRRGLFRSRLYSALTRLLEPDAEPSDDATGRDVGELLGVDVLRENNAQRGAEEKRQVRDFFEDNIRGVIHAARRAGARVVLCTVASNLRDWVPNQSFFTEEVSAGDRQEVLRLVAEAKRALSSPGDGRPALAGLERARDLAPGYAETHFLLGRAYEAEGRWTDALAAYGRARDEDGQPARALGSLNGTVRRLAEEEEGVLLLDVERLFEESSPHGLVGFNLIEDYVHPNPGGHRLIALALYRLLLEEGIAGEPRTGWSRDTCARSWASAPRSRPSGDPERRRCRSGVLRRRTRAGRPPGAGSGSPSRSSDGCWRPSRLSDNPWRSTPTTRGRRATSARRSSSWTAPRRRSSRSGAPWRSSTTTRARQTAWRTPSPVPGGPTRRPGSTARSSRPTRTTPVRGQASRASRDVDLLHGVQVGPRRPGGLAGPRPGE
jgi:lysophospholipase L1-like esterase